MVWCVWYGLRQSAWARGLFIYLHEKIGISTWEPVCRYLNGQKHNERRVKGRGHRSLQMLLVLCSAETRAEDSSSKPLLLHPHAGRRHREYGAQVPSFGHRHGRKPEADRPVLAEGCPGREAAQQLPSCSLTCPWRQLLKGKGPGWHCPSTWPKARGLRWAPPPALGAPACASL